MKTFLKFLGVCSLAVSAYADVIYTPLPGGGVAGGAGSSVTSSNALYANQIFVDAVSGNDSNHGSINDPFASITAGYAAATNGMTVVVLRGTFVDNMCTWNGANLYVQSGVVISNSSAATPFFRISLVASNTITIGGAGQYYGQASQNECPFNIIGCTNIVLNVTGKSCTGCGVVSLSSTGLSSTNCSVYINLDNFDDTGSQSSNGGIVNANDGVIYVNIKINQTALINQFPLQGSSTSTFYDNFPYTNRVCEFSCPNIYGTLGTPALARIKARIILTGCTFTAIQGWMTGGNTTNQVFISRSVVFPSGTVLGTTWTNNLFGPYTIGP